MTAHPIGGFTMHDLTNRTFDEIEIDASESASRTLTATDVEALALAAGDVDGYSAEAADKSLTGRPSAQGAAAIAMVAGLLNRRLPGPGTAIASSHVRYAGEIYIGDTLTATVTAKAKHKVGHLIDFDCRCTNQDGDELIHGTITVVAPTERIAYTDLATPQLVLRRNDGFAKLLRQCDELSPVTCAIVHPCDRDSLLGAIEAAKRGLIVPVLVGPEAKIRSVAQAEQVDLSPYQIVNVEHSHAAAEKAVELARAGNVEALMKGSLHTDELMAAVVPSATGLRTARRISHVFVLDVPTYPRLLMVTDAAVNIFPDLECKADIAQNAIELAQILGIETPKIAILSAVETITPKIPSTIDAASLCKMADRGQIVGGILDGPLAFDNAISLEAARTKKIVSPVAGLADILLVPDLEAGNMVAKQLQYLAGADAAGIVLGTRVPIVLTSRADNVRARLASTAVLKLVAHARRSRLLPR
jgi:phosphotransacetylase/acyl dehydratase